MEDEQILKEKNEKLYVDVLLNEKKLTETLKEEIKEDVADQKKIEYLLGVIEFIENEIYVPHKKMRAIVRQ